MTLVWTAAILAVIVAALVYALWTVRINFRKACRLIWLNGQRIRADVRADGDDSRSRAAWSARRHVEYQHAMTLTLQRAELASVDAVVAAIDRARRIEVVA